MPLLTKNDIPRLTDGASYRVDYPLYDLLPSVDRYLSRGLDLDPDFQRGHVWTRQQQVAWIEYLLKGGVPYGDILLNHPGWQTDFVGDFVIVDGKQRLHACMQFMSNVFPVFLDLFPPVGVFARDFSSLVLSRINLGFAVNNLQTREQVLSWYLELNEGSVAHSPS